MSNFTTTALPTAKEATIAGNYISATNWLRWAQRKTFGFIFAPICDTKELNLGEIIALMTWCKCAFIEGEEEDGKPKLASPMEGNMLVSGEIPARAASARPDEPEEGAEYGEEDFDDEPIEKTDEEISGKDAAQVKAEIAAVKGRF